MQEIEGCASVYRLVTIRESSTRRSVGDRRDPSIRLASLDGSFGGARRSVGDRRGPSISDEQTPVQEPEQEQDFGDFWPEPEWIRILIFSSSRIISDLYSGLSLN